MLAVFLPSPSVIWLAAYGKDLVRSTKKMLGAGDLNWGNLQARTLTAWRARDRFLFIVLAISLLYVLLRLTPSSYARMFDLMEIPGRPGLLGQARGIRSDEWAVWTPYFQAAVNNGFERFNLTSIYQEDLRGFNALPLWDWGLIFKPQLWAFFVLEPARAFSIYHVSIIAAFLIGWRGLFLMLGFNGPTAAFGSLLLFFTAGMQGWWTTVGPAVAFFPFLPWIFLARLNPALKTGLAAWATGVWLIGHLYPPIIISLGFAGAILVLAFRPKDALRVSALAPCLIGAAIGGAITYLYLSDAFAVMSATVYPGQRRSAGGAMPVEQWIAQFLPHFDLFGYATYLPRNYLEATTAGTYLPLLALCFADRAGLGELLHAGERKADRYSLSVLLGALALISIWQLAPVPQQIGALLFWDQVVPHRFVFATGVLTVLIALLILRAAPARLTGARFLIAGGAVILSFVLSKGLAGGGQFQRGLADLIPLLPLAVLFANRRKLKGRESHGVMAAALACGVIAFGTYNPLQSAWPIFHRPQSPLEAKFNAIQAQSPHHWLAIDGFDGATLNGWGFRSVTHVLIQPQLGFFRDKFPGMAEEEFNAVFNRYAHIKLGDVEKPYSPQPDVIVAPRNVFLERGR